MNVGYCPIVYGHDSSCLRGAQAMEFWCGCMRGASSDSWLLLPSALPSAWAAIHPPRALAFCPFCGVKRE